MWRAEDSFGYGERNKLKMEIYVKYRTELYGLLCSVTLDDAKSILKEMVDSGGEHDGFKGLLILSRRFDSSTAAGTVGRRMWRS